MSCFDAMFGAVSTFKVAERDFASPQISCRSLRPLCVHGMGIIIQLCIPLNLSGLPPGVFIWPGEICFSWLQIMKEFWTSTSDCDLDMQIYVR